MGPVMSQFGLPSEVSSAANTGNIEAVFKALEDTSSSSGTTTKEDDKKKDKSKDDQNSKKDDDAGMSLD